LADVQSECSPLKRGISTLFFPYAALAAEEILEQTRAFGADVVLEDLSDLSAALAQGPRRL
jgi:hypothetical protein